MLITLEERGRWIRAHQKIIRSLQSNTLNVADLLRIVASYYPLSAVWTALILLCPILFVSIYVQRIISDTDHMEMLDMSNALLVAQYHSHNPNGNVLSRKDLFTIFLNDRSFRKENTGRLRAEMFIQGTLGLLLILINSKHQNFHCSALYISVGLLVAGVVSLDLTANRLRVLEFQIATQIIPLLSLIFEKGFSFHVLPALYLTIFCIFLQYPLLRWHRNLPTTSALSLNDKELLMIWIQENEAANAQRAARDIIPRLWLWIRVILFRHEELADLHTAIHRH